MREPVLVLDWDSYGLQQLLNPELLLGPASSLIDLQRLLDRVRYADPRVQASIWILEDALDVASDLPVLL